MATDTDFLAFAVRRCGATDVLAAARGETLYTAGTTPGGTIDLAGAANYDSDPREIRFWTSWDRTGRPVARVRWDEVRKVLVAGTTAEDLDQLDGAYRRYVSDHNPTQLRTITRRIIERGLAATPQQEALF